MNKTYKPKRKASGSVKQAAGVQAAESAPRRGIWKWAAALGAVTVVGLMIGSTAWTAGSTGGGDDERGVQEALAAQEALAVQEAQDPAGAAQDAAETEAAATVWREDFVGALRDAGKQGKPVLLRFTASWCNPCQVMERQVWPQEEVRRTLAEHAIPVKIDIDQESQFEVVQRYGVRAIPALVLVNADGEELARGGFMSVEALVEFLRET